MFKFIIVLVFAVGTAVVASEDLKQAEKLLRDKNTKQKGVALLRNLSRSNPVARARLAQYLRTHQQVAEAMRLVEAYGRFESKSLEDANRPLFFEHCRCLAVSGKSRESLKRLDFAKKRGEGYVRADAIATTADVSGIGKNWQQAVSEYKSSLKYGDGFYKRKRISSTDAGKTVPNAHKWKSIRPGIERRLKHAQRMWEIEKFGLGFVEYRDCRTAHLNGKHELAIAMYNNLASSHPETVYAEAAEYYREQCRISLGKTQQAISGLQAFYKASPLGLYRGNALLDLGTLALERDQNLKLATSYFDQLLDWTEKVRQQRGFKLYAVPQKAKDVSAPANRSQRIENMGRIVQEKLKPAQLVNRTTAKWLLNDLKRDGNFYRGFLYFAAKDYQQAKRHFNIGVGLDATVLDLKRKNIPNLSLRLETACEVGFFSGLAEETKRFTREHRTLLLLADFYGIWEKWGEAKSLYARVYRSDRSKPSEKAYCLISQAHIAAVDGDAKKARVLAQSVVASYPKLSSAARAELYLAGSADTPTATRLKSLQSIFSRFPNSDYGQKALAHCALIHGATGNHAEANRCVALLKRKNPQNRFIVTLEDYLKNRK